LSSTSIGGGGGGGGGRDRELENLVGQFLVASFQTDKLAELIYEKLSFRGRPKEFRLFIPPAPALDSTMQGRFGVPAGRPPLLVTLRIEPYAPPPAANNNGESGKREEGEAASCKIFTVLESPALDISSRDLKGALAPELQVEEMLEGSFSWWHSQDRYRGLKLNEWRVSTSMIDALDDERSKEIYRILDALAAKRAGEQTAGP
jgi:hypothetical protein